MFSIRSPIFMFERHSHLKLLCLQNLFFKENQGYLCSYMHDSSLTWLISFLSFNAFLPGISNFLLFFQMFINCYISLKPHILICKCYCFSFAAHSFISNGTKLLLWRGINYLLVFTVLGYLCSNMFCMNWGRRCRLCLSVQFLQYHKHASLFRVAIYKKKNDTALFPHQEKVNCQLLKFTLILNIMQCSPYILHKNQS